MIIPRIYTNKPRTTGEGYKGMLHQPKPDQAPDLLAGIIAIRKMHIRAIEESGLTSADEMLYPENRSYLDAVSYTHLDVYKRQEQERPKRMSVRRSPLSESRMWENLRSSISFSEKTV